MADGQANKSNLVKGPDEPAVEDPNDRKSRMRSIYIIHFAMLIFSLGFSIVLTGVYPYLLQLTPEQDNLLLYYGLIIAANPLGQMIFSPILGWIATKTGSVQLIGIVTSVVYIAGNILYATLSAFPEGNIRIWMMLLSRFAVGASSANTAPMRAYIAASTYVSERTTHMAILSAFQSLGFVVGPGIQAALTPIKCNDLSNGPTISFDMFTVAGWASAAAGVLTLVLFLPGIFHEHNVSMHENTQSKETLFPVRQLPKIDYLTVWISIINFFIIFFNFVLVESMGTPLCLDQLGWTQDETVLRFGSLMAGCGVMCIIIFVLIGPICKRFDERKVLIFVGISFMILGRIVMFPWPGQDYPKLADKPSTTVSPSWNSSTPNSADFDDVTDDLTNWYLLPRYTERNVECGNPEIGVGCDLDWCEYTPGMNVYQIFGGIILGTIGYPFCVTITQSIFSKMLGPRPQGLWMGYLTAAGSSARVAGPVAVSFIYEEYGTYPTIGMMIGSLLFSLLLTIVCYKRMVPANLNIENRPENSEAAVESSDL